MTEYTGTAYVGVVGPEQEIGECRDSIENIKLSQGDTGPRYVRATKGYEARQLHINNFIDSGQKFLLLLDHDMYFQPDTLTRLRSHKLPYVSGLYMRRNWKELAPVWYRKFEGRWPMEPWVGELDNEKLHEIGASGWGCILIHRDVILETRELLKGEWEVLEDDMDIMPYDLKQIMRAINGLTKLTKSEDNVDPALIEAYAKILREEIVPLRADRGQVGSDIRFPFFAKQAGFQLMGDPKVRPGHDVHFPLNADMYQKNFTEEQFEEAVEIVRKGTLEKREEIAEQKWEVNNA